MQQSNTPVRRESVASLWDGNAEVWARLVRLGFDIYRDQVSLPAFIQMLPPVAGIAGLDAGCGEGYTTRRLAALGARMAGLDISPRQIGFARGQEQAEPQGIGYVVGDASALPFPDRSFDFVAGFMSFMDMPDHEGLASEVYRVLRPGGFLVAAISHPCFGTPPRKWVYDSTGHKLGLQCGGYFEDDNGAIEEWMFSKAARELKAALPKFKVPRFRRTLSGWLNLMASRGFLFERAEEPYASDAALELFPELTDTRIVPFCLLLRFSKPGTEPPTEVITR